MVGRWSLGQGTLSEIQQCDSLKTLFTHNAAIIKARIYIKHTIIRAKYEKLKIHNSYQYDMIFCEYHWPNIRKRNWKKIIFYELVPINTCRYSRTHVASRWMSNIIRNNIIIYILLSKKWQLLYLLLLLHRFHRTDIVYFIYYKRLRVHKYTVIASGFSYLVFNFNTNALWWKFECEQWTRHSVYSVHK